MKKDKVTGIVLGFVSLLFLFMTWSLPVSRNSATVGPRTFPYMAGGGLLLCAIALLLQKDDRRDKDKAFLDRAGWLRVVKLLGLLILFPLLFHFAGFITASFIFLFLMILLFDLDREVPIIKNAALSLAITISLFALFTYLLKIQLPRGIIFEMIRS